MGKGSDEVIAEIKDTLIALGDFWAMSDNDQELTLARAHRYTSVLLRVLEKEAE